MNYKELLAADFSLSLKGAVDLLGQEGLRFVSFIRKIYPRKRFNITLVVQVSEKMTREVTGLLKQANILNKVQEIKYGFTITRSDDNSRLRALWRTQWCQIVYCGCRLSFSQQIRVVLKWFQQTISLSFKHTER